MFHAIIKQRERPTDGISKKKKKPAEVKECGIMQEKRINFFKSVMSTESVGK